MHDRDQATLTTSSSRAFQLLLGRISWTRNNIRYTNRIEYIPSALSDENGVRAQVWPLATRVHRPWPQGTFGVEQIRPSAASVKPSVQLYYAIRYDLYHRNSR